MFPSGGKCVELHQVRVLWAVKWRLCSVVGGWGGKNGLTSVWGPPEVIGRRFLASKHPHRQAGGQKGGKPFPRQKTTCGGLYKRGRRCFRLAGGMWGLVVGLGVWCLPSPGGLCRGFFPCCFFLWELGGFWARAFSSFKVCTHLLEMTCCPSYGTST